jgi:hypothetical protein
MDMHEPGHISAPHSCIHALFTLSGPSWENTPSVFSKFTLIRGVYRELYPAISLEERVY